MASEMFTEKVFHELQPIVGVRWASDGNAIAASATSISSFLIVVIIAVKQLVIDAHKCNKNNWDYSL